MHIYPDGGIHLINAPLAIKHSLNFYTIKSWGIKWIVSFDTTDTKIKFESAYNAAVDPKEIIEGHFLEIKGKLVYDKNTFEHKIEPTLIRDLNIKTGEPPAQTTASVPTLTSNLLPSTSKLLFTQYLKYKSRGEEVARLQSFLKKTNFLPESQKSTGYFGPATEKALMKFQKANAIEALGILGPKTRAFINSLLP